MTFQEALSYANKDKPIPFEHTGKGLRFHHEGHDPEVVHVTRDFEPLLKIHSDDSISIPSIMPHLGDRSEASVKKYASLVDSFMPFNTSVQGLPRGYGLNEFVPKVSIPSWDSRNANVQNGFKWVPLRLGHRIDKNGREYEEVLTYEDLLKHHNPQTTEDHARLADKLEELGYHTEAEIHHSKSQL